jgi:hypothetical protein
MEIILHFIGYTILWIIGILVFPLIINIIYGFLTKFEDEEGGQAVFVVGMILYFILTGVFLIIN